MRIAFISYEFPPDTAVGGIATYVAQASRMLAARGHDVEVFSASPTRSGSWTEDGLCVHRVQETDRKNFRFSVAAVYAARAEENPFDILEGPEYLADASEAARAQSGAAVVVRMHTPSYIIADLMRPNRFFKRIRTEIGARRRGIRLPWWPDPAGDIERAHVIAADAISVPSRSLADRVSRDWKIDRQRIEAFPNVYQPEPALLAISPETRTNTVTFIGRLEVRKGIVDLADAVALVLERAPQTRFRFIGPVPGSSPAPGKDMKEFLLARLGAAAHAVEFVPAIERDQLATVLGQSDICVFPSIWENFPYVCLEAMAAARGVVGSRAGGMSEMIESGKSGLLVEPRSPKDIAQAIISFIESPETRIDMGAAARQRVLDEYSRERIAPIHEAFYQRAISRKAPQPSKTPMISVLMPVFNGEAYLARAIESILAQSLGDFEFLIIDDGSTDRSAKIAREFAAKDGRIQFHALAHQGLMPLLKNWLGRTRGEFIARMDADDVSEPQRFARQIEYLQAHPECAIVGSRVKVVDPYGCALFDSEHKLDHDDIEAELMRGSGWAIVHPAAMMRRSAALAAGGYSVDFPYAEDLDLFLRLSERGRIANLPDVLLHYRQHPRSINRTRRPEQVGSIDAAVREAYRRRGQTPPDGWKYVPKPQLAEDFQLRDWAWRALKGGHVSEARRHALAAWRSSPLNPESWRTLICALRGH